MSKRYTIMHIAVVEVPDDFTEESARSQGLQHPYSSSDEGALEDNFVCYFTAETERSGDLVNVLDSTFIVEPHPEVLDSRQVTA